MIDGTKTWLFARIKITLFAHPPFDKQALYIPPMARQHEQRQDYTTVF